MKELTLNQMELLEGQGFWGGLCVGMGAVSVGVGIAATFFSWIPIGWVGGAILAADAACVVYGFSQLD
ncbi:hypothetical protein [uncultured Tenacibaculum sp.]|uniref:hypothetical protein n=1 Tax=uncultured Tenacibaculum sp. TaxID=174713 RepID=UPI00262346F0|nr:hypothetical protein [uncultured Tenacibaculum sp.]